MNNKLQLSDPDKTIKVNIAHAETIQKVTAQETAVKVVCDQDDQDVNVHSDKNNNEVTKCDSFCQTDTSSLELLSDQTNTSNMYIQTINRMEEFFTKALQKISDQQACMLNSKVDAIVKAYTKNMEMHDKKFTVVIDKLDTLDTKSITVEKENVEL
ncbi:unnamed protein product [Mytilus coruscus]|uniref:Uncharacterized protein n=1 Tax=Mytilus coruscus TaxID=42192 RepID=A0A6J8AFW6_MYTCO|nr:unnamed protein product [Mytilus coruscus]